MSVSTHPKNGEMVTSLSNSLFFPEENSRGNEGFTVQVLWESTLESWWLFSPGYFTNISLENILYSGIFVYHWFTQTGNNFEVYFVSTLTLCSELNWKTKQNSLSFIPSTIGRVDFWSYSSEIPERNSCLFPLSFLRIKMSFKAASGTQRIHQLLI